MPRPCPLPLAALEELAATHGTPYQLYDEAGIRSNCRELIAAFRAQFPSFKQYFAVKALPNPAILRILVEEGCGLDCSSTSELHIAQALGVTGTDVMYTSNYTSKKDLALAVQQGVVINLDDISLIEPLAAVGGGRTPELISFRLNPGLGRTDSETKSNVLGGPDAKFGVAPFQIVDAYRKAKASGSTRFGMHMMTGSCVLNAAYWDETVTVLVDTAAKVHAELGITFDFVNIGGGLGIPYRTGQEVVDVPALAAQLAACVKARWAATGLEAKGLTPPALFMENGRYMTGPFGFLVARCEVVKNTWARYYGLDACMSNLMRPGMYGSYHHITVPAREGLALDGGGVPRASAHVVGTLCENNDWFAKDRDLPAAAAVGDLFVIHDTGAHSHSMGFQYNGKLRAPELLLRGGGSGGASASASSSGGPLRVDLIRERESISCLYDNTMLPKDLEPPAASLARPYPYSGRAASAATAAAGGAARRASLVGAAEELLTRTHTLSVAALALAIVGVAVAVGRASK